MVTVSVVAIVRRGSNRVADPAHAPVQDPLVSVTRGLQMHDVRAAVGFHHARPVARWLIHWPAGCDEIGPRGSPGGERGVPTSASRSWPAGSMHSPWFLAA